MRFPLLAGLLLASGPLAARGLGLEAYLEQVRRLNPALAAAKASDAAYALAAKEPLTAYSPLLRAAVQKLDDSTQSLGASAFSPQDTGVLGWQAGFSKLLGTGTRLELAYRGDRSTLSFPSLGPDFAGFLPSSEPSLGQQLSLSLSQPLWRNFYGAEVDAAAEQAAASADAARAGNRWGAQALLLEARAAYAQVATLRQVLAILEESLQRNRRILDWTRARVADNLADRVDQLQAEAALRAVALQLAENREALARAEAAFNTLRGSGPQAAVEELRPLELPRELPRQAPTRQDLEAARAALRSSRAAARLVAQRFTPDLSLFANLSASERGSDASQVFADALRARHGQALVGLQFTANLDLPLYRQVLAGAEQARGAGEAQVQARSLELERDWTQLQASWKSLRERLQLAAELEGLQKEKAEREKERYRRGRSSGFQVLRFEDDYHLARLQSLQLAAAGQLLLSQARYFNGEDAPW